MRSGRLVVLRWRTTLRRSTALRRGPILQHLGDASLLPALDELLDRAIKVASL
jgi:hypothetical protein